MTTLLHLSALAIAVARIVLVAALAKAWWGKERVELPATDTACLLVFLAGQVPAALANAVQAWWLYPGIEAIARILAAGTSAWAAIWFTWRLRHDQ